MTKDNRGFQTFAKFKCSYGTRITVKESSSATAPHIWIFMDEDPSIMTKPVGGSASAHLSFEQAKRLIDALNAAMAEHYQIRGRYAAE